MNTNVRIRRLLILMGAFVSLLSMGGPSLPAAQAATSAQVSTIAPITLPCNPTGGSGGLAVGLHEVTLAGHPAKILVGTGYDPSKPTYLAFNLHGDEGGYDFPVSSFSEIRKLIDSKGWVFVSPQAPAVVRNGSTAYPWYGTDDATESANAAQVRAVLDHMFAQYNVCRNIVFGSTVSGGSFFYDSYFFPFFGDTYPAFTNINCGAGGVDNLWTDPYNALVNLSKNADVKARSEAHYTIGTADFLYENVQKSLPTYTNLGFNVSSDIMPDVGHCAYNTDEKTSDYWTATAAAITATTNPAPGVQVTAGSNQLAELGTSFATPLTVTVYDNKGAPQANAIVTFSAPTSGASATFSSPTATTNASGVATVTATPNNTAGTYQVTARVNGITDPATFTLTNAAQGSIKKVYLPLIMR